MFTLARELGMTVAELGRRMDSRELSEWMAVYGLEADEQAEGAMRSDLDRKAADGLRAGRGARAVRRRRAG